MIMRLKGGSLGREASLWSYSIMDCMLSKSSKTRNPVTHLQKAAITSAMASSQVVEWYLP